MFLIHERKFTETHEEMFRECCKPKISHCNRQEKSIINAIRKELPAVKLVYCWNRDIQLWCRKHGAPKADISIYLRQLFHSFKPWG